ncbi:MAG: hypothetical protein HPY57_02265 [Ignavibacteria bacterium]|nr:hypothetical protein [Ignavibacteria bacterium]
MVQFNLSMGDYTPKFFTNPSFQLSKVDLISVDKTEDSALKMFYANHSFTYVRDKIRHIDAYDLNNKLIPFEKFPERLKIKINSQNLFKVGKYLSRIFRPTKYGAHFDKLSVFVNDNYPPEYVDGISLISQKLAKSLGWNASPNQTAQFTLFYDGGLVKGHAVVSDKIKSDVVIYSGNLKQEVRFEGGYYVALEPVKLSRRVNMDIQSLINLWALFRGEQYFDWFINSVEQFKSDLVNGKLSEWLDDLDELDPNGELDDSFTLRTAIRHGVDYRKFPGLMRSAWNIFQKSLLKIVGKENAVNFRIPIFNAYRAYLRVDLRNHNEVGDFDLVTETICLDEKGNLWVNPHLLPKMFKVLGGADQDDSVVIIPVKGGEAIIYRNPNQFGEYQKLKLQTDGVDVKFVYGIKGLIPYKDVNSDNKSEEEGSLYKNPYLQKYLSKIQNQDLPYDKYWLSRTVVSVINNEGNIGFVANAEMVMNSVALIDKKMFKELKDNFNWNLEKVIDSAVKDNADISDEINKVYDFYEYCVENEVPVPLCLEKRIPEKFRNRVAYIEEYLHPLDELYIALVKVIEQVNKEIIGEGVAGKDRIKGLIDYCEPPVENIFNVCRENPFSDYAVSLLKSYNRGVAAILDDAKEMSMVERIKKIEEGIRNVQLQLSETLSQFSEEERLLIVQQFALSVYVYGNSIHDSIIWNKYVAGDMIKLLIYAGEGKEIKVSGNRYYREANSLKIDTDKIRVRVWSKDELKPDMFINGSEVLIVDKKVLCCNIELNIGDEVKISDGSFKLEAVSLAYSKKTRSVLKNSLTFVLSPIS